MPLGIISDSDFLKELGNSEVTIIDGGIVIGKVVEKESPGRKDGDNNVPESLQKIIAEEVIIEGRASALELADTFGISPSSVSAYTAGATSTATIDTPKKSLIDHLALVKKKASKRAGRTLLRAIDAITDDKLAETPAGVLASIAKNLSGVVRDLEPERVIVDNGKQTQFIVFAPQVSKESSFDVIELKE